MVSRPIIVNYTVFQNGPSSGGDTAAQSFVLCKLNLQDVFLKEKNDLGKTMIYRFSTAKIKAGPHFLNFFYFRINFDHDCSKTNFHVLCP